MGIQKPFPRSIPSTGSEGWWSIGGNTLSYYTDQETRLRSDWDEKEAYNYGIIPTFGSAMLVLLDLIEG